MSFDEANSSVSTKPPISYKNGTYNFTIDAQYNVTGSSYTQKISTVFIVQVIEWPTYDIYWSAWDLYNDTTVQCTLWVDGFTADINGTWVENKININAYSSTTQLMISAVTFLSMSSPQGIWAMLGLYRMFLLVPFTGALIPGDIIDYLSSLNFILFGLSFLPTKDAPGIKQVYEFYDHFQVNEYMRDFKLKSSSSLANHINLLLVILLISIIHLCFFITLKIIRRRQKDPKKCMLKWTSKAVDSFTFDVYVRIYFESGVSILLNWCLEIFNFNLSDISRVSSFLIWVAYIISAIAMTVTSFIVWRSLVKKMRKPYYFKALFLELRLNEAALLYNFWVILRRVAMILFIVYCQKLPRIALLVIFGLLQLSYLTYVVCRLQIQTILILKFNYFLQ